MTHRTELFRHEGKLYDIRIDGDAEGYRVAAYQDGRSLGSPIWLRFETIPGATAESFRGVLEEIVNVQKNYICHHAIAVGIHN